MKLAKVEFAIELLEAILTASQNDYVHTDCPQDIKIVRVIQDDDDQANHRVVLVVESEEADWPEQLHQPGWQIPFIKPFTYTVEHPDEDKSPPTTGETDG